MNDSIRQAFSIILFGTFPLLSFSQTKLDTVYYDINMKVVDNMSLAETYEIRFLRKGKPHGIVKRFNKQDQIIENTNYTKGKRNGAYFLIKGDSIIRGEYLRNKKVNLWTSQHIQSGEVKLQLFDTKGQPIDIGIPDKAKMNIEIDASFPGGPKAWQNFLVKNLRYPASAKNAGIQGFVKLKFVVKATGDIEDIVMVSSPHVDLTKEAIRVLNKSPRWVPARRNNQPFESEMKIMVAFRFN